MAENDTEETGFAMSEELKNSIKEKSCANHVTGKETKYAVTSDPVVLYYKLSEYAGMIRDNRLMNDVLEMMSYFNGAPSSSGYHHAYPQGNIEHTCEVVEIAISMAKIVEKQIPVDYDVLIAGAILHDIGKEDCYTLFGKYNSAR